MFEGNAARKLGSIVGDMPTRPTAWPEAAAVLSSLEEGAAVDPTLARFREVILETEVDTREAAALVDGKQHLLPSATLVLGFSRCLNLDVHALVAKAKIIAEEEPVLTESEMRIRLLQFLSEKAPLGRHIARLAADLLRGGT